MCREGSALVLAQCGQTVGAGAFEHGVLRSRQVAGHILGPDLQRGLLHGATVTKPITKGQLITTANTAVPANSKIAELRARQDRLVYGQ